ncbi:MAG: HAMP domain-containing histidine kinase [Acidimicrobiales bacterium]|nr:HAMP domain-containing histidine kinase [Acidimicrobiales bacterium]
MLTWFQRSGLRTRLSAAFALGALLVTTVLAATTLGVTRQVLLAQRESGALDVAFNNASRVSRQLTPDADLSGILSSLITTEGSRTLLRLGETREGSDVQSFGPDDVPAPVVNRAKEGIASQTRTVLDGNPTLIIGLPIPGFDAQYYEAVDLSETDSTLRTLGIILITTAAGTTMLGALLGWWASRRTLSPLREISDAAAAIAGGRLDTRLDPKADRDLERLSSSFNEMAGALEHRIQRDARFATEVSHELRSPLMTLTASMEVLNNTKAELSPRAATALQLLDDDINRFAQLVEDLLEISRFDVGSASLQVEEIAVCEFVRQAIRLATTDDIPVLCPPRSEALVIEADKRRLAQVMANLVRNADKYGGGATAIEIEEEKSRVRISVIDEGPGVPADEALVIFDRFSRGSAGGRRGDDTGVGLGLSLVEEHVRLHGGTVWVEKNSDAGSGARFVVELPITQGALV